MFYVQVARLEDPDGAGRQPLLIVGGTPDGRGVVTSASYEVRSFGVRSAMPTAEALRLCPGASVVPVPRGACSSKSRAIGRVLEGLSPVVQAASIDEFYLDLGGTERLFSGETLEDTARRIQRVVREEAHIAVSIGGGTNRLVAKVAAGQAKPGGVRVVPPGSEAAFMAPLPLSDIPGVGPTLTSFLAEHGLIHGRDAVRVGVDWLVKWLGEERGRWLLERAQGLDGSPVRAREPRRSVSSERTFFRDLTRDDDVERELLRLARSAAAALRGAGLRARTVTVKLRDPRFQTRSASHTLPDPVETDPAVFTVARGLLQELRERRRTPVRLLGVALSGLIEADAPRQMGLFGEGAGVESERDRLLSRVSDDLRERFGNQGVFPARLLKASDRDEEG